MAKSRRGPRRVATQLALVPAVAHAVTQAAPHDALTNPDPPPSVQDAIRAFEKLVGGRAMLIDSLSTCQDDPDILDILQILGLYEPDNPNYSLVSICREGRISAWRLFSAFERAALARGQLLSKVRAAAASPQVTDEMIKAALPHEAICTTCNGEGTLVVDPMPPSTEPTSVPCHACNEVGKIRCDGSFDQQKAILDIVGVIPKKAGPSLVVPIRNTINPGPSLEQLQQSMASALYDRQPSTRSAEPPIDATPLPEKDPA